MSDAEIIIVAKNLGDLRRRSDQRGSIAVGARKFGYLRPEMLVDTGALFRERRQPPCAGSRMAVSRFAIPGLVLQSSRARQNLFGLCPCLFLGVGEDRESPSTKSRTTDISALVFR